jgi:hypothetical protein
MKERSSIHMSSYPNPPPNSGSYRISWFGTFPDHQQASDGRRQGGRRGVWSDTPQGGANAENAADDLDVDQGPPFIDFELSLLLAY